LYLQQASALQGELGSECDFEETGYIFIRPMTK